MGKKSDARKARLEAPANITVEQWARSLSIIGYLCAMHLEAPDPEDNTRLVSFENWIAEQMEGLGVSKRG